MRIIDLASSLPDVEELKRELGRVAGRAGFDNFVYLNLHASSAEMMSSLPTNWQQRYLLEDWSLSDPVVRAGRRSMRAFTWHLDEFQVASRRRTEEQLLAARDHGLNCGLSVPVRIGFGHLAIFSFTAREHERLAGRHVDDLVAATAIAQLHCCLRGKATREPSRTVSNLTPRQAVCLRWTAEGKTMQDIATMEEMTYSTVAFHLNNARRVLDAGTLPQATAIATRLGLI
ncbi:MAG: LuxR family transcriptional regulator [Rhizobium sp.]|nr:LuxR family transcriptional regulator [Rhizobium sp.]MBW8319293.1 LuxR family transcriptional regulator [Rhizobium sp.]